MLFFYNFLPARRGRGEGFIVFSGVADEETFSLQTHSGNGRSRKKTLAIELPKRMFGGDIRIITPVGWVDNASESHIVDETVDSRETDLINRSGIFYWTSDKA